MTKVGHATPKRAAPVAADFEGEMRVCVRCGKEKPLGLAHWRKTSGNNFRSMCRTCHNQRQSIVRGAMYVPLGRDKVTKAEASDGVWTASDLAPRGEWPIVRDWDLTCGQCGELWMLKMTDLQARGLAMKLQVLRARCGKCGGWVGLDIAFTTIREVLEEQMQMPDSLSGPKDYGQPFVRAQAVA